MLNQQKDTSKTRQNTVLVPSNPMQNTSNTMLFVLRRSTL